MGPARFLRLMMRKGIGAPARMAKTQAKIYNRLRLENPGADEQDVLRTMYVQRALIGMKTGAADVYAAAQDPHWVENVVRELPNLLSITLHIIFNEHPELRRPDTPPEVLIMLEEVVTEVLDKEAPSWRVYAQRAELNEDEHDDFEDPGEVDSEPYTEDGEGSDDQGEEDRGSRITCPACHTKTEYDLSECNRVNSMTFTGRLYCRECGTRLGFLLVIDSPFVEPKIYRVTVLD